MTHEVCRLTRMSRVGDDMLLNGTLREAELVGCPMPIGAHIRHLTACFCDIVYRAEGFERTMAFHTFRVTN